MKNTVTEASIYEAQGLKDEALEIYKRENKESVYIPAKTEVILKDGTKVNIGTWGNRIKTGNTQISSELREEVLTLFPKQFENNKSSKD